MKEKPVKWIEMRIVNCLLTSRCFLAISVLCYACYALFYQSKGICMANPVLKHVCA